MSNIHSELVDSQLHNPKGFTSAGNNTYLIKDNSGNLAWDGIQQGATCGIINAYDYARFSTSTKTYSNASIFSVDIDLINCSGLVGQRLEMEVYIVTTTLPTGSDPSCWIALEGDNSQQIICNQGGGTSKLAPASPPFAHCGNAGIKSVVNHYKTIFDVTTSPMTKINMKLGSVVAHTINGDESFVIIKSYCNNSISAQNLG